MSRPPDGILILNLLNLNDVNSGNRNFVYCLEGLIANVYPMHIFVYRVAMTAYPDAKKKTTTSVLFRGR